MSPLKTVLRWYMRWFLTPQRDDFSSSFAYQDRIERTQDYRARPCFSESADTASCVRPAQGYAKLRRKESVRIFNAEQRQFEEMLKDSRRKERERKFEYA